MLDDIILVIMSSKGLKYEYYITRVFLEPTEQMFNISFCGFLHIEEKETNEFLTNCKPKPSIKVTIVFMLTKLTAGHKYNYGETEETSNVANKQTEFRQRINTRGGLVPLNVFMLTTSNV
jgi:hypothetical protein